jgi:RimJ/RimL family protein N-acetyltransferase
MHETPEGETIRIVDITPATLPRLEELHVAEVGGFNDLGLDPLRPVPEDAFVDGRMRTDVRGVFFIERKADGAIVGSIQYNRVSYGPADDSRAWMIGIGLFPEARGQGIGTEAQRLFAAWLFDTTDVNRVEASTDVENIAEARSLEKAGFTREGIVRGAQFRAGAYHDLVLFATIRSDPR